MHRAIVAHAVYVDDANLDELRDAAFVFIAIDDGPARQLISSRLEDFGVPFIDVGMGIFQASEALGGIVRTTASVPDHREHAKQRMPFADDAHDEYDQNIQIADLNMLNASLVVCH